MSSQPAFSDASAARDGTSFGPRATVAGKALALKASSWFTTLPNVTRSGFRPGSDRNRRAVLSTSASAWRAMRDCRDSERNSASWSCSRAMLRKPASTQSVIKAIRVITAKAEGGFHVRSAGGASRSAV